MSEDLLDYLKHIAEECSFIISVSSNLSEEEFLKDEISKRAIVRSLEIIGEAAKKIPDINRTNW